MPQTQNLIKLDLLTWCAYHYKPMEKTINTSTLKATLAGLGWTQKRLAEEIGVTSQAVTNWLQGNDFPRPDKLLKLATTLKLNFDQLVSSSVKPPIVAFRKKGGAKTTEQHVLKALAMGVMLKPLVQYLPAQRALRTQIPAPSTDYEALQSVVADVRDKLGIGMQAVLQYQHLFGEFEINDAVIVPVLWGHKQRHENALHILLQEENVTFIYLNLDTHLEDFKFWMAHELAHVYTPNLAGTDDGEDFADAFAGALLFPRQLAESAYADTTHKTNKTGQIEVLSKYARDHKISLFSVYREVINFAQANNFGELKATDQDIHAVRNNMRDALVSEALFKPLPPDPTAYVAATHNVFKSSFFIALQRMLRERGTAIGYIQQVLDVSLRDATALHVELLK